MKLRLGLIGVALAIMVACPLIEPRLLAFPYAMQVGADRVYSAVPLPQATLTPLLARANRLVGASPLHVDAEGRSIFLTDGGWRWRWLAGSSQSAFALTRPLREAVIVNRADLVTDRVFNGAALGGTRSLSGVIAHEKCHGMVRRRFGVMREHLAPLWLREGYCDHVARESSLSDAQARALETTGRFHPALAYVRGRQKVDALLAANGGNIDQLFETGR